MTRAEILKKAIHKSLDNGLDWMGWSYPYEIKEYGSNEVLIFMRSYDGICRISIRDIIFSHDFAKAFWGEELKYRMLDNMNYYVDGDAVPYSYFEEWQYHLQQMVLESDPISYLAKFL